MDNALPRFFFRSRNVPLSSFSLTVVRLVLNWWTACPLRHELKASQRVCPFRYHWGRRGGSASHFLFSSCNTYVGIAWSNVKLGRQPVTRA